MATKSSGSGDDLLRARLVSVSLSLTTEEIQPPPEVPQIDYREKIKYFLEYQKIKLVSLAVSSGENEQEVVSYLENENISDFDLNNLKSRLAIKRADVALAS